ncbi:peptide chain release factor 1 [Kwoniella heveanensis BCC8398]|uniref:Peptide chain release factor 1 n=1 Tax=Kwoniella heveanensis BCC8398 TaxID=1296120 RepID=A0A1B9GYZ1_9TREE|nr:peptide chain release factor 1 [Kwoniella heveanensis BCC8398]
MFAVSRSRLAVRAVNRPLANSSVGGSGSNSTRCFCGCSKFRPGISTSTTARIPSPHSPSHSHRRQHTVHASIEDVRIKWIRGYATSATATKEQEHGDETLGDSEMEWFTETEEKQAKLVETARKKVEYYKSVIEQETDATDVQGQIARAKMQRELGALAEVWDKYLELRKSIYAMIPELDDPDPTLREMFESEYDSLCDQLDSLITDELPRLLLPQPETASLPCMISLNAGVGGLESALCTEDLSRMYIRFAEKKGWKVEEISRVEGTGGKGGGGIRELTLKIEHSPYGGGGGGGGGGEGKEAGANEIYGLLQWEKGVHRVQRVPANETMGRIHTSTVAVIVLPIYPDTENAPLVDPKDVKIDVMRARGAGGQHVNRTESAVRLTHLPTGITVSMQDSRSQHQNRAWAWDILRARLSEKKHNEEVEARRATRRDQVKGADRSDKIRTYNFNQDRLTDHRFGFTLTGLQHILDGDGLEDVIALMKRDLQERRLESLLRGEEDIDY